MPTLQELKTRRPGPYPGAIRVLIVAVGEPVQYGDQEKQLKTFSVADESTCMRAVCFDSSKFKQIQRNTGVVVRNVIVKNGELIVTSGTKIFTTSSPDVSDQILDEGREMIHPQPPKTVAIATAKHSPEKQRVSVRGKVTNEGLATTVLCKNKNTAIKTITVEDESDTVKVALWRNMAEKEIHPGDFIELTHLVVNQYGNNLQLSTTQYSDIKKIDEPEQTVEEEILGYEEMSSRSTHFELVSAEQLYIVRKELFDAVEVELPQMMKFVAKGSEIQMFL